MKKKINYEISSGNIFEDLGLPNPQEELVKAELVRQINNIIKKRKMTQKKAAEILNIEQPKVSNLQRGKLSGFSMEKLCKFLNLLEQDVTIKITPKKPKRKAAIIVSIPKTRRNPAILANTANLQSRKSSDKKP